MSSEKTAEENGKQEKRAEISPSLRKTMVLGISTSTGIVPHSIARGEMDTTGPMPMHARKTFKSSSSLPTISMWNADSIGPTRSHSAKIVISLLDRGGRLPSVSSLLSLMPSLALGKCRTYDAGSSEGFEMRRVCWLVRRACQSDAGCLINIDR